MRMRAQGKRIIYADANGEGQTHKDRVIFLLGTVAVSRTQTSQKCECLVRIPFTKTPLTDLPNPSSVKQPAKRPTCAVLKLTPHTAVVGSTFPGVLSQKQILQPSATQREKRPETRRKLQTSADLPTEFVRFFSLNSVGSQRPFAVPAPSLVPFRAVLLMDYQLAGTLPPVTIKGCYTFQVGERF